MLLRHATPPTGGFSRGPTPRNDHLTIYNHHAKIHAFLYNVHNSAIFGGLSAVLLRE